MRKIFILILSATLIMGVGGCTSNKDNSNSSNNTINNSNGDNKKNENNSGKENEDLIESKSEIEELGKLLEEKSDKIIELKGKGTQNTYEKDGKEYLSTLIYPEKLLGYDTEKAFNFDDDGKCTGIVVNFSSGSNEEIVKTLKATLGEVSSEENRKGENGESYLVKWDKGSVGYEYIYSMGISSINIYKIVQ